MSALREVSYAEFGRRLRARLEERRVLTSASMELTDRCNLTCAHCYIRRTSGSGAGAGADAGEDAGDDAGDEMTAARAKDIIDQLADHGALWLLLTGGEPLSRPDFWEIYEHAKRRGMLTVVFTNGTLIDEPVADRLAALPPFAIEITLYGATAPTYERVTGVGGSHAKCMRGINLLHERGIALKLKTIPMTLNRHELDDMKAIAKRLGVSFRFDPLINCRVDGGDGPAKLRLSPEEIVAIDREDEERTDALREFCERYDHPIGDPNDVYVCGAGLRTCHIDWRGRASVCMLARRPRFDLATRSFDEIWNVEFPRVRARKRTRPSPCGTCEIRALCGQCPGWSQLEHGDDETPVEFLCDVAHRRAGQLAASR